MRIVHRPDGTAVVDGVPVALAEGQDVRDAAYQAAVRAVHGAAGPVAATRVEADGREYPLMLYPAAAARLTAVRPGWIERVRERSRRWPAAALCGCALLVAVLASATALLGAAGSEPGNAALVRLTVDQENRAVRSPVARAIGQGIADLGGPSASPRASAQEPGAAGSAGAGGTGEPAGGAGRPDPGATQTPSLLPAPAPAPVPQPGPGPQLRARPQLQPRELPQTQVGKRPAGSGHLAGSSHPKVHR